MSAGDQAIIYPAWTWKIGFLDKSGRFIVSGRIEHAVGHFEASEIAERLFGNYAVIQRVLRTEVK